MRPVELPSPGIHGHTSAMTRTGLYLVMILTSVVLALAALWLGRRLVPQLGAWGATLLAIGGYLVVVGLVMWALPTVAQTPQPLTDASGRIRYPGFPADDLYHFRLYAVGAQVVIWAVIGLVFGTLTSRLLGDDQNGVPLAVLLDAPIDHGSVWWALGACVVEGAESVRLGLEVDHRADVAERAVHVDDDCRLAIHGTPEFP